MTSELNEDELRSLAQVAIQSPRSPDNLPRWIGDLAALPAASSHARDRLMHAGLIAFKDHWYVTEAGLRVLRYLPFADAQHAAKSHELSQELRPPPSRDQTHPALEIASVRHAITRVLDRLAAPLADTWGCTHAGHLATIVERLGHVSTEVQNVSSAKDSPGAQRNYREDLVRQLAELGANVLVMLAEELETVGQ